MNGIPKKFAVATLAVATAAAGLLASVTPASAQTNLQPEPPRVSVAHTNHLKATVLGVDYKNREVILQGTNGSLGRFAVSDRIVLIVAGGEALMEAVTAHRDWISAEVLAPELHSVPLLDGTHPAYHLDLDGLAADVTLTRIESS